MRLLLILRDGTENQAEYEAARNHLLNAFPDAVFTDEFDSKSTAFQIKTVVATERYFTGGIDPKVWIGINASDVAIDVLGALSEPGDNRGVYQFTISKVCGWVENDLCRSGRKLNHSGFYGFIGHCYGIWKYRLKYLGE